MTREDINTIKKAALEVSSREKAERLADELTQILEFVEAESTPRKRLSNRDHSSSNHPE